MAILLPALLGTVAHAAVLSGERVAVGLAADGSLGDADSGVALLWDPDGPEGPEPLGGDLVAVGRVYEVWALAWEDGARVQGAPALGSDLVLDWGEAVEGPAGVAIEGVAEDDQVAVWARVFVPFDGDLAWFDLEVEARAALPGLWAARVVDPDIDTWVTGSYETSNRSGEGWAVAEGEWAGRALALAARDGVGGLCSWCASPSAIAAEAGAEGAGDLQIGVAVDLGDLDEGDRARVAFVYGLALGADEAAALALDAVAGDDRDGDGVAEAEGDCDDLDPGVGPGAAEAANGRDDDCDGRIDEGTAYGDDDGDGLSEAEGDCDDADAGRTACDTGWSPLPGDRSVEHVEEVGGCAAAAVGARGGLIRWTAWLAVALRRRGGRA